MSTFQTQPEKRKNRINIPLIVGIIAAVLVGGIICAALRFNWINLKSISGETTADTAAVTELSKTIALDEISTNEQVLKIVSAPSIVTINQNVTLTIIGKPNTKYNIVLLLPSGNTSKASDLKTKTTDANGKVSWSWKISPGTTHGECSVTISGGDETIKHEYTIGE